MNLLVQTPYCVLCCVFCDIYNIAQVSVMSHKVLPMEAKTALETPKDKWSTTFVTQGLNFLEIKTEPVKQMDSGQEHSRCVFVRYIWLSIII